MDDEDSSTTASPPPDSPVGSGDYVVAEGDCLSSIAFANGHFWKTLWNHSANAELKQKRTSPFLLLPGDRLTIPPIEPKEDSGATEQRHKFKLKGVPALVRIQILEPADSPPPEESAAPKQPPVRRGAEVVIEHQPEPGVKLQPAKNKPYQVLVDDVVGPSGQTDENGRLKVSITPSAQRLVVRLEPGTHQEREIVFLLGHLNPLDTRTGQAQRLANLGYPVDPSSEDLDGMEEALEEFQKSQGLEPNGRATAATLDKLKQVHGS